MNSVVVSLLMGLIGSAVIFFDNTRNNNILVDKKTYIKYFVLIAILTYCTNWMCINKVNITDNVTKEIFTGNPGF
tara:strand:- start:76 stop:300 length:225 start_codon:yes stop_codon:yes gene_type:complete